MKWATRKGCHVDRVACAWLIKRFIDSDADFAFVEDPAEVPVDATPFDIPGVALAHHGDACSFETFLATYGMEEAALRLVARTVHEADIGDGLYDAHEAAGMDVLIRGLSMVNSDDEMVALCMALFDGLYEYYKRAISSGRRLV